MSAAPAPLATWPWAAALVRSRTLWLALGSVGLAAVLGAHFASAATALSADAVRPPGGYEAATSMGTSSISDAANYLAFSRWQGANGIASPDIKPSISAAATTGLIAIAHFAFLLSSALAFVIGFLLIQAVQLNILDQLAFTLDYVFASVGSNLIWGSTGSALSVRSVTAFGLIVLTVIAFALLKAVRPTRRMLPGGGGGRGPAATLAVMLGMVMLFAVMTSQAMKNHDDPDFGNTSLSAVGAASAGSSPGSVSTSRSLAAEGSGGAPAVTGRVANWAPFSPGWLITLTNQAADIAVSVVASAAGSLDTALGGESSSVRDQDSACSRYVTAMHDTFTTATSGNAARAGSSAIMVRYDDLVQALYFDPYVLGAYGTSAGARNSWCRLAEQQAGSAVGDQVHLSIKAGSYREVTTAVARGGEWGGTGTPPGEDARNLTKDESVTLAASFFGPAFVSDVASRRAANYFAACVWPTSGADVALNSGDGWDNVTPYVEPATGAAGAYERIKGGIKSFLGKDDGLKQADCAAVTQTGFETPESGDDAGAKFGYTETTNDNVVFSVAGIGNSTATKYFVASNTAFGGKSPAFDFYQNAVGLNPSSAAFLGVISVFFAILAGKYILPFAIGGLIAQGIEIIAWIFMVFVFFLLIIPSAWTKRLALDTAKTIAHAFFVSAVFIFALSLMLAVSSIFRQLFFNPLSAGLLQVFQLGAAILLAFIVTGMFLKRVLGFDFHSLRSTVKSATSMSAPMAAQRLGMTAPSLLRNPDEIFKKSQTKETLDARREARDRAAASAAARAGATNATGGAPDASETLTGAPGAPTGPDTAAAAASAVPTSKRKAAADAAASALRTKVGRKVAGPAVDTVAAASQTVGVTRAGATLGSEAASTLGATSGKKAAAAAAGIAAVRAGTGAANAGHGKLGVAGAAVAAGTGLLGNTPAALARRTEGAERGAASLAAGQSAATMAADAAGEHRGGLLRGAAAALAPLSGGATGKFAPAVAGKAGTNPATAVAAAAAAVAAGADVEGRYAGTAVAPAPSPQSLGAQLVKSAHSALDASRAPKPSAASVGAVAGAGAVAGLPAGIAAPAGRDAKAVRSVFSPTASGLLVPAGSGSAASVAAISSGASGANSLAPVLTASARRGSVTAPAALVGASPAALGADLSAMTPGDARLYSARRLAEVSAGALPSGAPTWYAGAPGTMAGVLDPISGQVVPAGLITAGPRPGDRPRPSPEGNPVHGLRASASGLWVPDQVAQSVPKALAPSRAGADQAPPGVSTGAWGDWKGLRSWSAEHAIEAHTTDVASWPPAQRARLDRLSGELPGIYAAMDSSAPNVQEMSLGSLGAGLASAPTPRPRAVASAWNAASSQAALSAPSAEVAARSRELAASLAAAEAESRVGELRTRAASTISALRTGAQDQIEELRSAAVAADPDLVRAATEIDRSLRSVGHQGFAPAGYLDYEDMASGALLPELEGSVAEEVGFHRSVLSSHLSTTETLLAPQIQQVADSLQARIVVEENSARSAVAAAQARIESLAGAATLDQGGLDALGSMSVDPDVLAAAREDVARASGVGSWFWDTMPEENDLDLYPQLSQGFAPTASDLAENAPASQDQEPFEGALSAAAAAAPDQPRRLEPAPHLLDPSPAQVRAAREDFDAHGDVQAAAPARRAEAGALAPSARAATPPALDDLERWFDDERERDLAMVAPERLITPVPGQSPARRVSAPGAGPKMSRREQREAVEAASAEARTRGAALSARSNQISAEAASSAPVEPGAAPRGRRAARAASDSALSGASPAPIVTTDGALDGSPSPAPSRLDDLLGG